MAGGKHILGKNKQQRVFGTAKVGDRGQIVIPKAARDHLGLQGGDRLIVASDEHGVALIRADFFEEKMRDLMARLSAIPEE